MQKKLILAVLILSLGSALMAAEFEVDFPVLGEVGFIYESDHYSVSIGPLGTYSVEGYVNSSTDFNVTTDVPAGEFTDYIPVVGQIIGLFGLDTVKIHLSDKPSDGKAPDFGFGLTLEAGGLGLLRGDITEALALVPGMESIINTVISLLEIVDGELYGQVTNDSKGDVSLYGTFNGTLSILAMNIGFDFTGNLSPEAIIDTMVDEIAPVASKMASELGTYAYKEAEKAMYSAFQATSEVADQLYNEVGVIAHDVSASISHSSHSFDTCYGSCVPNYANSQSDRLREGSVALFEQLYYSVYSSIILVNGKTPAETERLRSEVLAGSWNSLSSNIASEWDRVYNDDEVENYFFKSSSERQGRDRYKQIVQEDRVQYEQIRDKMFRQLLTGNSQTLLDFVGSVNSWTPGISLIETYSAGGSDYMLLLKPDHSMFWVLRLNADGNPGAQTWFTADWQPGISAMTTYESNGQNYLIASNPTNGSSWIFPLTNDGQVLPPTMTNNGGWEVGISGLATYDVNGRDYMLLSNPTNGHAWVYELNSNGTMGNQTWFAGDWTLGNSIMQTYEADGKDFLFLSNPIIGHSWIFQLGSNGQVIGYPTWEPGSWEKGIDSISILDSPAGELIALVNSGNGHAWIYSLNSNGTLGGNLFFTDQWVTGITTAKAVQANNGRFLLLAKPDGQFWSFKFK